MDDILLILSFLVEPVLWSYASSVKFRCKSIKVIHMFILLDFAISVLEQYANLSAITGQGFLSLSFFVYTTLFVCMNFEGAIKKKILHAGTMLMITLASDIIVIAVMSIVGVPALEISNDKMTNAVAILLAKCVMCMIIKLYIRKIVINSEYVPFMFLIAALEVPGAVNFKNNMMKSNLHLVAYMLCQVAAGVALYYIKRANDRKREELSVIVRRTNCLESKLRDKTLQLEQQMEQQELLEHQLESVKGTQNIAIEQSDILEILENRQKVCLNKKNIMYIERSGRKIAIVGQDKQYKINSSIKKLESELDGSFVKISQGMLVNKIYIEKIENEAVYLTNNVVLYASRDRAKQIESEVKV